MITHANSALWPYFFTKYSSCYKWSKIVCSKNQTLNWLCLKKANNTTQYKPKNNASSKGSKYQRPNTDNISLFLYSCMFVFHQWQQTKLCNTQNAWCMSSTRRTCRVVSCWDVTGQVEFGLMTAIWAKTVYKHCNTRICTHTAHPSTQGMWLSTKNYSIQIIN